MSDRALPEGVVDAALDLEIPEHCAGRELIELRLRAALPKIEAHLATRLLSDKAVEAVLRHDPEYKSLRAAAQGAEFKTTREACKHRLNNLKAGIRADLQAAISAVIGREAGNGHRS